MLLGVGVSRIHTHPNDNHYYHHNLDLRREATQRSEIGNEGTRTRLMVKKAIMILMMMILLMVIMMLMMMMMMMLMMMFLDIHRFL